MKLQRTEILPYLIYGNLTGFNSINHEVEFTLADAYYHLNKGFTPILRPLTDLTKEIVIGKEKFVPIEVLFEKEHPRHLSKKYYTQTYYNYASVSHNGTAVELKVYLGKIIEQNPRWIFEYLIRWNFDVFGLIDKNLAIDINTQPQE